MMATKRKADVVVQCSVVQEVPQVGDAHHEDPGKTWKVQQIVRQNIKKKWKFHIPPWLLTWHRTTGARWCGTPGPIGMLGGLWWGRRLWERWSKKKLQLECFSARGGIGTWNRCKDETSGDECGETLQNPAKEIYVNKVEEATSTSSESRK